jgi:hypothetical protein
MEYESKLTDIIESLPEINGGFLYAPERGIYSNQTAGIADDLSLQDASVKLNKIVSMMAIHFHDTEGIRVTFKDIVLYGVMIEDNHWLFLFYQPSLSYSMVKMTVQIALNIKFEENEITDEPPPPPIVKKFDIEDLAGPGSVLGPPLVAIQEELATHIGPVAEPVFLEAVEEWSKNSPSIESLPELISSLEVEIDDERAAKLFVDNLQVYAGVKK